MFIRYTKDYNMLEVLGQFIYQVGTKANGVYTAMRPKPVTVEDVMDDKDLEKTGLNRFALDAIVIAGKAYSSDTDEILNPVLMKAILTAIPPLRAFIQIFSSKWINALARYGKVDDETIIKRMGGKSRKGSVVEELFGGEESITQSQNNSSLSKEPPMIALKFTKAMETFKPFSAKEAHRLIQIFKSNHATAMDANDVYNELILESK